MNFSSKNFTYVTKKFGDFLDEIEKGSKLYLRSLSAEKASELPADIVKDYPSISADFQLPPELASVTQNAHSSPLRISGPVNMWLHYDVSLSRYIITFNSSANNTRLWPMFSAKSEVLNVFSCSRRPMSNISISPQVLQAPVLMFSRTSMIPSSHILIHMKSYFNQVTYSSYPHSGSTQPHPPPA